MLGPWPRKRGRNEKTDKAAKEAASRPPESTYKAIPLTDMRRPRLSQQDSTESGML